MGVNVQDYRVDTTALSVLAKDKVLQYIGSSELGADRKLPREEELARIVGVSRVTLRTALNELALEGIITRQHGRGTFVSAAAANLNVSLNPMAEFMDMIRASGYRPEARILGVEVESSRGDAAKLGLDADTPLVVARKIVLADGRFCALCVDHFPLDLIGRDALDQVAHYADSVFRYIAEKSGRRIVRDRINLQAVSGREAQRWAPGSDLVPGGRPLLKIEGLNYDEDDRPILVAREYVDTEVIAFSLIRQRRVQYG